MEQARQELWKVFGICIRDATRARVLALRIPSAQLDRAMLVEFRKSRNVAIRNLALELFMLAFPNEFDRAVLCKLLSSGNENIRDMAKSLLMQNFSDTLDYATLIAFQESDNVAVCNIARLLLMSMFPERLGYALLIEFHRFSDIVIRDMASGLVSSLPAKVFDYTTLVGFYEDDDDPRVSAIAALLLLQHFPERLGYATLVELRQSRKSAIRNMAVALLARNFSDKSGGYSV